LCITIAWKVCTRESIAELWNRIFLAMYGFVPSEVAIQGLLASSLTKCHTYNEHAHTHTHTHQISVLLKEKNGAQITGSNKQPSEIKLRVHIEKSRPPKPTVAAAAPQDQTIPVSQKEISPSVVQPPVPAAPVKETRQNDNSTKDGNFEPNPAGVAASSNAEAKSKETERQSNNSHDAPPVPVSETRQAQAHAAPSDVWMPSERRRAVVSVVRAEHLPKKDMMGKCDPYVVLTWQGKERKTQVKKSTFDPVWEETLEEFDWVDAGTCASLGRMKVTVMDDDGLTSNDYVAESEVSASVLLERTENDFEVCVCVFVHAYIHT
jgi:hypothetical protein